MPMRSTLPDGLPDDANEILSVWTHGEEQTIVIPGVVWDDPGVWGILVADIARHAAKAYGLMSKISEAEALDNILDLMESELYEPHDDAETDDKPSADSETEDPPVE